MAIARRLFRWGGKYATGTQEIYYLRSKEDEADDSRFKLYKYLLKFDGGVKKLPRVHQYFGIKAAQQHVREKKVASFGTRRAAEKESSWCCWPNGFWKTIRTPALPSRAGADRAYC
jgi:hypothetical protein